MDSAFICFYKSHSLQPTQILWSSHICVYLCTSCSNWKIWIYLKWFFFFFLVCSSWHILIFHWDFFERNSHLWHSFSVLKGAMHILKMLFESFINPLSKFDLVHCTDATTLYRSSGVFNPTWIRLDLRSAPCF